MAGETVRNAPSSDVPPSCDRAVILAAGRGTRMRRPAGASGAAGSGTDASGIRTSESDVPEADVSEADTFEGGASGARASGTGASLTAEQRRAADRGLKGLIPIHGHPFLDHVLSALADGGIREVCLVVAPDSPVQARYEDLETRRLTIAFAEQHEPIGTADAVVRAEGFAGDEPFLVVNADNLYPPAAVEALRAIDGPGLAGFRRSTLVAGGIPAERVAAYAILTRDDDGCLEHIIEKPDPQTLASLSDDDVWVSMTCWRFDRSIFDACRRVEPSSRGERELPDAVSDLAGGGRCFHVVPVDAPVLDLSRREDVPVVAARLRGRTVSL